MMAKFLNRRSTLLCLVLCCLVDANLGQAQSPPANPPQDANARPGQFVNHVITDEQGDHKYVVFVPGNYDPTKKWPVILYLHGASNRGTDGRAQLVSGLASSIRLRMSSFPFIAVFPQCEDLHSRLLGGWTEELTDADRALRILDRVENDYSIDRKRECLLGISMGGAGAWKMAARTPERWAALVTVSALGDRNDAAKVARIPTWVFHAVEDPVVDVQVARDMVTVMNQSAGRAYISEVDSNDHDISKIVFTQQPLIDWLLNPAQVPKQELSWSVPEGYDNGLDAEIPFVPGAEISRALRVRLCHDTIEAFCIAATEKAAAKPMSGAVGGVQQTKRVAGIIPVDVALSGLQYQGQVEQFRVIPKAPNRLLIQIALRNITMTIPHTQVNGRLLLSASAGPMNIMVGHRTPVWLTMEFRPYVQNRHIYLNLAGTDFRIPDDNIYVSEPASVHVRGMPFMNRRASEGFVNGTYAKKGEIERQITSQVPKIVQNLETQLNEMISSKARLVDQLAKVPVWQQRMKLFPEELSIDDHGVTLVSGIVYCTLGHVQKDFQVRKYSAQEEMPPVANTGLEITVAETALPAWCDLIIAGGTNKVNVLDFTGKQYHIFADRDYLQQVIPDLKRYGDEMEAKVEVRLDQPVRFLDPAPIAAAAVTGAKGDVITVALSSIPISVAVRQKGEKAWTNVGEMDLSLHREYAAYVRKTGFVKRGIVFDEVSPSRTDSKWTFASGYRPDVDFVDHRQLADRFVMAKNSEKSIEGDKADTSCDFVLNGVPLRQDHLKWANQHVVVQMELPGVLISNESGEAITYEILSSPNSWNPPKTLAAGKSEWIRTPSNLICRRRMAKEIQVFTLPVGKQIVFYDKDKPAQVIAEEQSSTAKR